MKASAFAETLFILSVPKQPTTEGQVFQFQTNPAFEITHNFNSPAAGAAFLQGVEDF